MIGSLGSVTFEVSENNVRTFSDLSFTHSANFAEHKIIARKGLLEFTGLNSSSCSLKISLNASLGINPDSEINKLLDILNSHQAVPFTIGGKVLGSGLWVIDNMNVNYDIIGSAGETYSASVSLNLKEYLS